MSLRIYNTLSRKKEVFEPLVPGQVMYAVNPGGGLRRILWQVIKSQPAGVLAQPTDAVRKQVIDDYKLLQAYGTSALKAAEKIAEKARTEGLEAAAKTAKLETIVTEATTRLTMRSPQSMVFMRNMQRAWMNRPPEGMPLEEYNARIQAEAIRVSRMVRPYEYLPSMIEGVDLKTPAAYKRFLDRVFELVPEDIDEPVAPGSPGPVVTIPMPTARAHFVVQRVGYTPAVADDFKETERRKLADQILATGEWIARVRFFGYKTTIARTEYKVIQPKQSDQ